MSGWKAVWTQTKRKVLHSGPTDFSSRNTPLNSQKYEILNLLQKGWSKSFCFSADCFERFILSDPSVLISYSQYFSGVCKLVLCKDRRGRWPRGQMRGSWAHRGSEAGWKPNLHCFIEKVVWVETVLMKGGALALSLLLPSWQTCFFLLQTD